MLRFRLSQACFGSHAWTDLLLTDTIGLPTVIYSQSASAARPLSTTPHGTTTASYAAIQSPAVDGLSERHTSAHHPPLAWMGISHEGIYRLTAFEARTPLCLSPIFCRYLVPLPVHAHGPFPPRSCEGRDSRGCPTHSDTRTAESPEELPNHLAGLTGRDRTRSLLRYSSPCPLRVRSQVRDGPQGKGSSRP